MMLARSMRPAWSVVLTVMLLSTSAWCARAADDENHDPLEAMNRGIFWFNDQVDTYVLVPVATGWDKIMPNRVQRSISNFFTNLRFPIVTLNNLLQAKFKRAGSDVGRFVVNTTVGIAGFFDPATDWGMEQHDEDFGQTLGFWGVPPGPYLVIPILGPSDIRDAGGLAVDGFCTVYPWFVDFVYTASAYTVNVINTRSLYLKQVEEAKAASFDYYVAVRKAYSERRKSQVNDGAPPKDRSDELYTIEEDSVE